MKHKWQFLPGALLLVFGSLPLVGQVTIPNIFVAGDTASAEQVNENFDALRAEIEALQAEVTTLTTNLSTVETDLTTVETDLNTVQADLSAVQSNSVLTLDGFLERVTDDNGYATARFSGVNLQVVHGAGIGEQYTPNGLGNVIIGYNGARLIGSLVCSQGFYTDQTACENAGETWARSFKTGSHNLVVGTGNAYGQTYGVVMGESSVVNANQAVAIGGKANSAVGEYASFFGGESNTASASGAVVSGGTQNIASDIGASVSGGTLNEATGRYSSVSGGSQNQASGENASVLGGLGQTASANDQTIPAI
jgi:hypothetical protein